jgi:enediyne biosynthesis protein E4
MRKLFILFIVLTLSATQLYSQAWFNEISDEAGLTEVKGFRVWLADVNGDDYPDLLWGGDKGALFNSVYLMLNVPNPDQNSSVKRIFQDYTAESGLQKSRIDTNISRTVDIAALADLDNDGDLDIVTSIYTHRVQNYKSTGDRSEVMLNDGNGHFTLVDNHGLDDFNYASSLELGLTNTTGLSFLDYDLDGNIDLYVGTWFAHYGEGADVYMGNFLFKGNGDGTFQKGVQLGKTEPLYGTNVTDWNNDGWPDIINSPYCRTPGQFFKNVDGEFIEASIEAGYNTQKLGGDHGQNLCQWEANTADFDNDGDMDILEVKVHGGYNPGEGRTTITVNSGKENGFKLDWELDRIKRAAPMESHLGDQGGTWFDFDNDGRQDIALGQNSYPSANIYGQERLYLLLQDVSGKFNELLPNVTLLDTLKEAHSMEPADFDMDGDQDLFLSRIVRETIIENGEPKNISYNAIELIENKRAEENNFIQIKLEKNSAIKNANSAYIGAKIFVHSGENTQKQEIQSGLGHFAGMQPFIKTFGIGQQTSVDSIVVIYPNKNQYRVVIYTVPVNTLVKIGDGSDYVDMTNKSSKILAINGYGNYKFGWGDINKTTTKNLELVNLSKENNSPITITKVELEGDSEFSFDDSVLPITICCKDSIIGLPISLTPSERTEYRTKIKIYNNSDNTPLLTTNIFAEGFEPKPILSLNSTSIKFDGVWVDSTRRFVSEFTNSGEEDLEISSIELEGGEGAFSITESTPITLKSMEKTLVDIVFNPKQKDVYNAKINIVSNAFNKDTVSQIDLLGICDGPNSILKTNAGFVIVFGDAPVNGSKEKVLKLSNDGEGELLVNSIEIDPKGDFTHSADNFPLRIADEYDLTLTFSPRSEEFYTANIIINSDAVNEPKFEKKMTGTGVIVSNVDMWENGNRTYHFSIAPNPIKHKGQLVVESIDPSNSGQLSAEIYDVTGLKVMQLFSPTRIANNTKFDIDINNITSGTYYVRIFSDNESVVTLPIIVQK